MSVGEIGGALRFSGVSLRLGGRQVLTGLDIAVPEGAFVGVLGPNGAGKTTLMRAALGLIQPSTGRIDRHGTAGYLPQTGGHLEDLRLCGRDFVAAGARRAAWGLPIPDRAARLDVERVLALTDSAGTAHRPMRALSGGERQRLALAQALLGTPRLLVLDEPLAGLDPQHQVATVALVRRLQQKLGLTVLFSAHDLNTLLPVLDQVLYLGGGRAEMGRVAQVVTGPVLSRLYGAPMEVIPAGGRLFVVASERAAHAGL